jgi:hypothetical protein
MKSWTDGTTTVQAEKIGRWLSMGPGIVTIDSETVLTAPGFIDAAPDGDPVGGYAVIDPSQPEPQYQAAADFEAKYSPVTGLTFSVPTGVSKPTAEAKRHERQPAEFSFEAPRRK